MKLQNLLSAVALGAAALLALGVSAQAHEEHSSAPAVVQGPDYRLVRVDDKTNAAWLADARAHYPLNTCSVSGDKLDGGDMGEALDYVYEQAGRPDRLIRFCCKDCLKDFKKDPAKYLKTIDDAAAHAGAAKS